MSLEKHKTLYATFKNVQNKLKLQLKTFEIKVDQVTSCYIGTGDRKTEILEKVIADISLLDLKLEMVNKVLADALQKEEKDTGLFYIL